MVFKYASLALNVWKNDKSNSIVQLRETGITMSFSADQEIAFPKIEKPYLKVAFYYNWHIYLRLKWNSLLPYLEFSEP